MRGALNAWKVLATSWIALALMASGVSGVVLCIGPDGHISFELAHMGHCRAVAEEHGHEQDAAAKTLAGANAHCSDDCVDVSLSSDNMSQPVKEVRQRRALKDTVFQSLGCACLASDSPGIVAASPIPRQRGGPLLSAAFLSQRTIILRS